MKNNKKNNIFKSWLNLIQKINEGEIPDSFFDKFGLYLTEFFIFLIFLLSLYYIINEIIGGLIWEK